MNSSIRLAASAVVLLVTTVNAVAAAPPPEARPIVRSNQFAAGMGTARHSLIYTDSAAVNDAGQVAFLSIVSGGGTTSANNLGLWLGSSPTSHQLIARTGTHPPGVPANVRFDALGFDAPQLNNQGKVSFISAIIPAVEPIEVGAWTTAGGPLRLLAADRYPLPNAPGNPIVGRGVYRPLINDAGQTLFDTVLGTDEALWVDTPGQPLRRVVTTGDTLPGGIGLQLEQLGIATMDSSGRVAFWGQVSSGAGDLMGMWSEYGGSLQLVAKQGDTAPGGGSFQSLYGIMGSTGMLAIDANISGDLRAFYAQRPDGSLRLVARTEDTAPGTSETFLGMYEPRINAHGRLAFPAFTSGGSPSASSPHSIWAEDELGLELVAGAGAQAPGTNGGVFDGFGHLQFNDYGEVLFEAYLTQGIAGVDFNNDEGLWLRTRNGRLVLIAREGGQLDIAPGPAVDLRQIFSVGSISSSLQLPQQLRTLNNRGEVLFHANFQDGSSGLFLSSPVPEPSTIALVIIALFAAAYPRLRMRLDSAAG